MQGKSEGECLVFAGYRSKSGYGLVRDPEARNGMTMVHRLAWVAHRGSIPPAGVICHRCDNPPCFDIDHLFLGTQGDNIRDAFAKGRMVPTRGDRNNRSRLTPADIPIIRRLLFEGASRRDVAARYGVSKESINGIAAGRRWAWVQ